MPAIAVAGAAMAWSAVSTVGVITAIGATIGAVGAITGNKTLSMIGAGMSVVGGISSLAGAAGSSASNVGTAAAGAADDVASAAASGTAGSQAIAAPQAGVLDTSAVTMGADDFANVGAASQPMNAPAAVTNLSKVGTADINSLANPVQAPAANAGEMAKYGGTADASYIDSSTSLDPGTKLSGGLTGSDSTVGQLTGGNMTAQPTLMDKFLTFTQKNGNLIDNGMKLVGNTMQGEFNQEFLDLKKQELGLRKQKQKFGNSVPDITGLLSRA